MNIFFLSTSAKRCAKYHCDKHVCKLLLEACQLLYTAIHVLEPNLFNNQDIVPYKKTHVNHPISKWVRTNINNYKFTCNLAKYLSVEYTKRYGKIHKCQQHVDWLKDHMPDYKLFGDQGYLESTYLAKDNIPRYTSPVPLAMPDEFKVGDLVVAYRSYYIGDKKRFAKWKYTEVPRWFV
jgi:hypothetical protein